MADRKPLSKKTRFEVLKRDKFTCQYCGAKAPHVWLEVDHRVPVCEGGGNEMENLAAACWTCNSGKSGNPMPRVISEAQLHAVGWDGFAPILRRALQDNFEWWWVVDELVDDIMGENTAERSYRRFCRATAEAQANADNSHDYAVIDLALIANVGMDRWRKAADVLESGSEMVEWLLQETKADVIH